MKYCEEYAALLDLFVDGELPPTEMERVREHLAACPGCGAYVDDALVLRAGFPDVEETAVPAGFTEGIMERIRAASPGEKKLEDQKKSFFRRWMGTAAALAACCALVVLVRTGSGGVKDDGSAAPAGDSVVSGYADSGEAGIEPQMAEDATETEESVHTRLTVKMDTERTAGSAEEQQNGRMAAATPAEAAQEAVMDEGAMDVASYGEIALCLTAEEAGDLLDEFAPEQEDATERRYTLSMEEYETLLEALGRWEKLPETPEMSFQVVVTGPFK